MNPKEFKLFLDVTDMKFVAASGDVFTYRTVAGNLHSYVLDLINNVICHLPNIGV